MTVVSKLFPVDPPLTYTLILPVGSIRMVHPSLARWPVAAPVELDVGREAKSEIAAPRQGLGLFLAEALVVEDLHGLLEGLDRGDVVIRHAVGVEIRGISSRRQQILRLRSTGSMSILRAAMSRSTFAREGFVLPRAAIGMQARGVGEHRLVVEA